MGIVVAVLMGLGVLLAWPWPSEAMRRWQEKPQRSGTVATGLMLGGLWNSAWHGLRHLGDFWGQAALVSGILMMAVAVLLVVERSPAGWGHFAAVRAVYKLIKPVSGVLVVGLLACFILYAVALVRLNLG
jgi:hypothetical protein